MVPAGEIAGQLPLDDLADCPRGRRSWETPSQRRRIGNDAGLLTGTARVACAPERFLLAGTAVRESSMAVIPESGLDGGSSPGDVNVPPERVRSFANLLVGYRHAAGLTQEELAARAGVSSDAV